MHCTIEVSDYVLPPSTERQTAFLPQLLTSQIRNEWCKLGNVFKTIVTCCAKEHLEVVLDKVTTAA